MKVLRDFQKISKFEWLQGMDFDAASCYMSCVHIYVLHNQLPTRRNLSPEFVIVVSLAFLMSLSCTIVTWSLRRYRYLKICASNKAHVLVYVLIRAQDNDFVSMAMEYGGNPHRSIYQI